MITAAPGSTPDLAAARAQVAAEARAVASVEPVIDDGFARVAETVAKATGTILTTAVGNSGAVAARLAHLLALCGLRALHLDANQALHGSVGAVRNDDVIIALSKGGRTDEVIDFARLATERGARLVVVTEDANSPLAALADQLQVLPESGADPAALIDHEVLHPASLAPRAAGIPCPP